jgi:hypothetical protein
LSFTPASEGLLLATRECKYAKTPAIGAEGIGAGCSERVLIGCWAGEGCLAAGREDEEG